MNNEVFFVVAQVNGNIKVDAHSEARVVILKMWILKNKDFESFKTESCLKVHTSKCLRGNIGDAVFEATNIISNKIFHVPGAEV
jgi:hypothetical protein